MLIKITDSQTITDLNWQVNGVNDGLITFMRDHKLIDFDNDIAQQVIDFQQTTFSFTATQIAVSKRTVSTGTFFPSLTQDLGAFDFGFDESFDIAQ